MSESEGDCERQRERRKEKEKTSPSLPLRSVFLSILTFTCSHLALLCYPSLEPSSRAPHPLHHPCQSHHHLPLICTLLPFYHLALLSPSVTLPVSASRSCTLPPTFILANLLPPSPASLPVPLPLPAPVPAALLKLYRPRRTRRCTVV